MMHIGLADFANPALLILGDPTSLNWLADCIAARKSIDLATSPFVELVSVGLNIAPTDEEGSCSRNDALLEWKISPAEALRFADQLRALAASETPGHAYLDPVDNRAVLEIIASKGEYNAKTVLIH